MFLRNTFGQRTTTRDGKNGPVAPPFYKQASKASKQASKPRKPRKQPCIQKQTHNTDRTAAQQYSLVIDKYGQQSTTSREEPTSPPTQLTEWPLKLVMNHTPATAKHRRRPTHSSSNTKRQYGIHRSRNKQLNKKTPSTAAVTEHVQQELPRTR